MKNAPIKLPVCRNPTAIPTKVGMVLLFVYWTAMAALTFYAVTVTERTPVVPVDEVAQDVFTRARP